MFDRSKWVWMDGELVAWEDATVHVSSHGLHYGTGVFEGIRCYDTPDGPAVFRLADHLQRLYASAAVYGIPLRYTQQQLADAVCDVIAKNGFGACYIRPIAHYGSLTFSLFPDRCPTHVSIVAFPWEKYHASDAQSRGVRVSVASWRKFHPSMMPSTAKACGQYVNSVLAVREAVAAGYDDAILLNSDGNVAEGSGENVFIVRDGAVITNAGEDSILLGVTRDSVIRIARDLGFEVQTRAIALGDLLAADEVFFTGTAVEVTPVRAVEDKKIGSGDRGPVTEQIQSVFFRAVNGSEPAYRAWLHPVQRQTAANYA